MSTGGMKETKVRVFNEDGPGDMFHTVKWRMEITLKARNCLEIVEGKEKMPTIKDVPDVMEHGATTAEVNQELLRCIEKYKMRSDRA